MSREIIGLAELMRLRREALAGDNKAADRLSRLATSMAKESNRRLSRLEKAGFKQYAYEGAVGFTERAFGSNRYIENLESVQEQYLEIMSMRKFLEKETSLIKGQRRVQRMRIKAFRDTLGLTKNTFSKDYMTNKEIADFLRFLGEKPIRNLLADYHQHGSGEIVELIRKNFEKRPSARNDILMLFREYSRTKSGGANVPQNERLYYDELMQYLKEGSLPDYVTIDEGKIKRTR